MSVNHYFRHLVFAYHHLHPIDEHRSSAIFQKYEKERLKEELMEELVLMESKCNVAENQTHSPKYSKLKLQILAMKHRVESS